MRLHLTGKFYLCEEHKDVRPDIQDDGTAVADWPEVQKDNVACSIEDCSGPARRVLKIFVDSENLE